MADVTFDDVGPEIRWHVRAGDSGNRTFEILDNTGAVVDDPEGDGWTVTGAVSGGDLEDLAPLDVDITGSEVTYTLPAELPTETELVFAVRVTAPSGQIRTHGGSLRIEPDWMPA